jgi:outer membrane immunogenic protein
MKVLLAAAALAGLALLPGVASAADLPAPEPMPPYKAPVVVPPAYNWSGIYLNAGGGGGMWNADTQLFTVGGACLTCAVDTFGGRGFFATVGGGFDYQLGGLNFGGWNPTIVAGLMADYSYEDFRGTVDVVGGALGQMTETGAWAGGARVGLAFGPNLFVYSNGGVTGTRFGGVGFASSITCAPAGIASKGFWQTGWFLGGGSETSLNPILPVGWFLRSEYRYSYFGTKNFNILGAGAAPVAQMGWHPTVQMLSTSLVYKFNFLN